MPPKPFSLNLDWMSVDPDAEKASKEAKLWATDPKARRRIEKQLADKGYEASDILTMALKQSADQIDAIDRRIASYELRRMAALKTIEQYSEILARRLETISSDVIEGEFTEAAE
jgi:glycerol-3-phosphate dehydrogenase